MTVVCEYMECTSYEVYYTTASVALGKPIDFLPSGVVSLIQKVFIFCFESFFLLPSDDIGAKKLMLIPSILFNDPGKKDVRT